MEKLELKHLAPYLPYGLKIMHYDKPKKLNGGQGSSTHWVGITHCLYHQYKPILRPLSDLTNMQGHHFVVDHISSSREMTAKLIHVIETNKFRYTQLKYWQFEKLVENHFDVFGLIEKNLAIDINSLKQ